MIANFATGSAESTIDLSQGVRALSLAQMNSLLRDVDYEVARRVLTTSLCSTRRINFSSIPAVSGVGAIFGYRSEKASELGSGTYLEGSTLIFPGTGGAIWKYDEATQALSQPFGFASITGAIYGQLLADGEYIFCNGVTTAAAQCAIYSGPGFTAGGQWVNGSSPDRAYNYVRYSSITGHYYRTKNNLGAGGVVQWSTSLGGTWTDLATVSGSRALIDSTGLAVVVHINAGTAGMQLSFWTGHTASSTYTQASFVGSLATYVVPRAAWMARGRLWQVFGNAANTHHCVVRSGVGDYTTWTISAEFVGAAPTTYGAGGGGEFMVGFSDDATGIFRFTINDGTTWESRRIGAATRWVGNRVVSVGLAEDGVTLYPSISGWL